MTKQGVPLPCIDSAQNIPITKNVNYPIGPERTLKLVVQKGERYRVIFPSKPLRGLKTSDPAVTVNRDGTSVYFQVNDDLWPRSFRTILYLQSGLAFVELFGKAGAEELERIYDSVPSEERQSIEERIAERCDRESVERRCSECIDGDGSTTYLDRSRKECATESYPDAAGCKVGEKTTSICAPCFQSYQIEPLGIVACEDFYRQLWRRQKDCNFCVRVRHSN